TPAAKRAANFMLLEDRNVPPATDRTEGGGEPHRSRPDHDQRAVAHFLRAIEFSVCGQCAIVPPPRITAATFNASDISSGERPASVHAEAYESMQYGS